VHAAHAEVAEFVFVGDPLDVGPVAHAARPQFELEVDRIFEGRAFAGAGAVAGADEKALPFAAPHPLDAGIEGAGGLGGMRVGAHRETVAAWAKARRGAEVQFRAGGIDEEVVADLLALAFMAGPRGFDDDVGRRVVGAPFRMERHGLGLLELDAMPLVDRRQREHHLGRTHQPHADPDVRRDPVVGRLGRHDHHVVAAAQPLAQEGGRGVSRNSGAEHDDSGHDGVPSTPAPTGLPSAAWP
jgi:hypothetical protein